MQVAVRPASITKTLDRSALRVVESAMRAAYESAEPVGRLGRALTQTGLQPTRLASAVLKPVQRHLHSRLSECLEDDLAENVLEILLRAMQLAFFFDPAYRRNLAGFRGSYQFDTSNDAVTVSAVFADERMKVHRRKLEQPSVRVTYASGRGLLRYLMTQPDVLVSVLRHEVEPQGNLNYLYRFGHLAKELQRMVPVS